MSENESVTWTLRCYAHNSSIVDISHIGAVAINTIADSIDARFDALRADMSSLQAEHNESVMHVKELQAELDASIPLPVDAAGVPWTSRDHNRPFYWRSDEDPEPKVLKDVILAWTHDSWCLADENRCFYRAEDCLHVAPESPDSQERINADAEIRAKLHIEFDVECQSVDTYVDGRDEITLFAKGEDGNHVDLLVPPSEDNGQLFRRRFHVIVEEAGERQA